MYHPDLARHNLGILRTAALVTLRKTRDHVKRWDPTAGAYNRVFYFYFISWTSSKDLAETSPLLAEHWDLIGRIYHVEAFVNAAMHRLSLQPFERLNELTMMISAIVLLAAASIAHKLLARYHPQSSKKCLDAVLAAARISSSFVKGDYIYLEPTLMVFTYLYLPNSFI